MVVGSLPAGNSAVANTFLNPTCLKLNCTWQLLIQDSGVQLEVILSPGDIWQRLKALWVFITGERGTPGIFWVVVKDSANCP